MILGTKWLGNENVKNGYKMTKINLYKKSKKQLRNDQTGYEISDLKIKVGTK